MAIGITFLGITGIGVIWLLCLLRKECNIRTQERRLVNFLSDEIRRLRSDVNKLKK